MALGKGYCVITKGCSMRNVFKGSESPAGRTVRSVTDVTPGLKGLTALFFLFLIRVGIFSFLILDKLWFPQ